MKLEFQGFTEESPEAIHRFKLALIADLEVDVAHAQRILQRETTTIIEHDSLDLLEKAQTILTGTGAQVTIVADDAEVAPPPPPDSSSEDDPIFSFEMDAADLLGSPQKAPDAPPKAYAVDLDDDLEQAAQALGFSREPVSPQQLPPAPLPPSPQDESGPTLTFDDRIENDLALGPPPVESANTQHTHEAAPLFSFDDLNIDPPSEPDPPQATAKTPSTETGLEASFALTTEERPPEPPAATQPKGPDAPLMQPAPTQQLRSLAPSSPAIPPSPPTTAAGSTGNDEYDQNPPPLQPVVTASRRTSSDHGFSRGQLIALFFLGVGLLGGMNWFFTGGSRDVMGIGPLPAYEEETDQTARPSPRPVSLPSFTGVARDKTVGLSVNLSPLIDGSMRAKVEGRGDNRPTYSAAEIARNLDKDPWITRVDADPFLLQKVGEKHWAGSGTAFIYIDALGRRFRATAPIRMTLNLADDVRGSADVEITLTPEGDPKLPGPEKLIESVTGEKFRAYLRVSVSVVKPAGRT